MGIIATALRMKHMLSPSTPSSGSSALYFGEDGLLYAKKSDGSNRLIEYVSRSLIADPGFEVWEDGTPTGWTNFWHSGGATVDKDTSDKYSGASSCRLTAPSGSNARIVTTDENVIPVNPGDLVTFSVYAKRGATSTGAKIEVQALTCATGTPSFFDGVSQLQISSFPLTTSYREYNATFVIPEGHSRMSFVLNPITNSSGVDIVVWVDHTSSYITSPASGDSGITGEIKEWPLDVIPSGYLLCDGSVHSISDYPILGSLLGNKYGGNGTTTFATPPLSDRFSIGASGTKAVGSTGGSTTSSVPAHTHSASGLTTANYSHNQAENTTQTGVGTRVIGPGTHSHNVTGSTGSAGSATVNTMPPWTALNKIIKT